MKANSQSSGSGSGSSGRLYRPSQGATVIDLDALQSRRSDKPVSGSSQRRQKVGGYGGTTHSAIPLSGSSGRRKR